MASTFFNQKDKIHAVQKVEQIDKYSVIVKKRLAEGAYGIVDLVVDQANQKELVLKRCSVQRIEAYEIVNKEIKMLQRFKSPYVVEYLASMIVTQKNGKEALVLLSYCPGGNLFEKIVGRNGSHLPVSECLTIFQQILYGVEPLHTNNPPVTHRDLKLENVLFAADGSVKLCDFGSCSVGHTSLRDATEKNNAKDIIDKETTPMYRAPEMIDLYLREVLTEKTDIWALGCILATICYLLHPFMDAGSLGILNFKPVFPTNHSFPPEIHELILRMIDPDPEARPTVIELIYFTQELLEGRPLPFYQLSTEAQERREARIKANTLTHKPKTLKEHPPLVKQRDGAAIGGAAMKRLMDKKGIVVNPMVTNTPSKVPSSTTNTTNQSKTASNVKVNNTITTSSSNPSIQFDADFGDDFFNTPAPSTTVSNASKSSGLHPTQVSDSMGFDFAEFDQPNTQAKISATVAATSAPPSRASSRPSSIRATPVVKIESADFLFDDFSDTTSTATTTTITANAPKTRHTSGNNQQTTAAVNTNVTTNSTSSFGFDSFDEPFFQATNTSTTTNTTSKNSRDIIRRPSYTDPFNAQSIKPVTDTVRRPSYTDPFNTQAIQPITTTSITTNNSTTGNRNNRSTSFEAFDTDPSATKVTSDGFLDPFTNPVVVTALQDDPFATTSSSGIATCISTPASFDTAAFNASSQSPNKNPTSTTTTTSTAATTTTNKVPVKPARPSTKPNCTTTTTTTSATATNHHNSKPTATSTHSIPTTKSVDLLFDMDDHTHHTNDDLFVPTQAVDTFKTHHETKSTHTKNSSSGSSNTHQSNHHTIIPTSDNLIGFDSNFLDAFNTSNNTSGASSHQDSGKSSTFVTEAHTSTSVQYSTHTTNRSSFTSLPNADNSSHNVLDLLDMSSGPPIIIDGHSSTHQHPSLHRGSSSHNNSGYNLTYGLHSSNPHSPVHNNTNTQINPPSRHGSYISPTPIKIDYHPPHSSSSSMASLSQSIDLLDHDITTTHTTTIGGSGGGVRKPSVTIDDLLSPFNNNVTISPTKQYHSTTTTTTMGNHHPNTSHSQGNMMNFDDHNTTTTSTTTSGGGGNRSTYRRSASLEPSNIMGNGGSSSTSYDSHDMSLFSPEKKELHRPNSMGNIKSPTGHYGGNLGNNGDRNSGLGNLFSPVDDPYSISPTKTTSNMIQNQQRPSFTHSHSMMTSSQSLNSNSGSNNTSQSGVPQAPYRGMNVQVRKQQDPFEKLNIIPGK